MPQILLKSRTLDLIAGFCNSCLFSNLSPCGNAAQKGTPDAFRDIAQQLGNGAIVEKLRSGRSFFGVRTRGEGSKGYAEKGAPAKKVRSGQQRLKTTQSNTCLQLPGERAHDLAGRCFFLTARIFPPGNSSDLPKCSFDTPCRHPAQNPAEVGSFRNFFRLDHG